MAKPFSLLKLRCGHLLSATLVFSIFTNLLKLTGPIFMLQVYDRVLGSRSVETLTALILLAAGLFTLFGMLEYSRGRVIAHIGTRFHFVFQGKAFGVALQQAVANTDKRRAEMVMQDLSGITGFFASPVLLTIFDVLWTPLFLLVIFVFHPLLGWLALCGGGLLIFAAIGNQVFSGPLTRLAENQANCATQFSNAIWQRGELIYSQGMAATVEQRWQNLQCDALESSSSARNINGFFTAFTKSFRLFLQSAMLALGAWLVLKSELTAGAMIASSILLGGALAPVEQGIAQWPAVQRARASWISLSAFLRQADEPIKITRLSAPSATIRARNITYVRQYGESPALQNISFDVTPGQALGIIGNSGSGKSTLARVLVGLRKPTAGEIRFGGATPEQYGAEYLGKFIGYVPQNAQIFDGTIAENIAQMCLTPDSKLVVAAAKRAMLHDCILSFEKGYDTAIGNGNHRLSGGQKQRLALARALYREPNILIMDEPNSSMDAEGSAALNRVITEMKVAKKAVIIIGHQPSVISQCDLLLVLSNGKPAAYGPRDNVIKAVTKNDSDSAQIFRKIAQ